MLLDESGENSIHTSQLRGFFNVHIHTSDTECRGNAAVDIVDDLHGGQFELMFCSTPCVLQWIKDSLDDVESQSAATLEQP